MLYEYILYLHRHRIGVLDMEYHTLLRRMLSEKSAVNIKFSTFAKSAIDNSDKSIHHFQPPLYTGGLG